MSGGTGRILCKASGWPLREVRWYKNDIIIKNDNYHQIINDGKLIIYNVNDERDSGRYSCSVKNRRGAATSQYFHIKVVGKAEILQ